MPSIKYYYPAPEDISSTRDDLDLWTSDPRLLYPGADLGVLTLSAKA
jgi:hypothetical protein